MLRPLRPPTVVQGKTLRETPPTLPPSGTAPRRRLPGPQKSLGPAEAARVLVSSYGDLDPALRTVPRSMHTELTDLTARWLAAGHHPAAVRAHILRHLPGEGTPVHRPGGLLRYLLRDAPPVSGPGNAPALRGPSPGAPAPIAEQPCPERLSVRLAAFRECEGDHSQATPFRPTGEETLCHRCLNFPASARDPDALSPLLTRGAHGRDICVAEGPSCALPHGP
ncbi:hypothetical protein [Streptomyces phaeoluteigriseus]|uniref:hypothetical protein n=1 Tax=Streptomyces phaeoluteigriseus TaxID=114686 RepID=UPI001B8633A3|nr:hypothetical protein [Streptomyces phaeoluteigriseus]